MCQDFRIRAVARPGLTLVRRPPPPPAFFDQVRLRLGPGAAVTDPAELIPYEIDAGQDRATPDGVVFPRSAAELAELVRIAREHRVVLVPRAAGTSLSGGPIAAVGGVVVAFSRMARVLSIDPVGRRATVEPCVINLELSARLAPERLFYPPDPASQRASTIGGNVSENAGGPHCFKYGVTTTYVQALELVLPSGETARSGGPAFDYPEYDFTGLLTGSEGTLAFITSATVRAVRAPPAVMVMMAVFETLGTAAESVSEIIARGLVPAALEMMDRPITRAVEDYVHAGLPDAEAILIVEIDGHAASLDAQASVLREICEKHGATEIRIAREQAERDRIWFARKSAAGAIARLAPAYYLQDGTVPRSRLGELMARVEQVGKSYGLSICNVFHAGDGNLHPLILFDPENPEQASKVVAASRDILEKCIEVGGNITGEHGVGVEKILEMKMQFTPGEIQVMREVKQVFDPEDRCNPSKILPEVAPDPAEWAPRAEAPASLEPESTAEVAAILRRRQAERAPIGIAGTRTGPDVLSLRRMTRVVEYAPQDLYLRVQAGMTLRELQEFVGRDGLWWPVPHPWPEATVGGMVAANWNGPARFRLGAIRDLVLGGVVVLPDGRDVRVGGKVVKNVAGYDMTKLHVGARGTLGVISELNLKLAARPAAWRAIGATVKDGVSVALRAFQESLVASSILVFGSRVVVTALGHPADVEEELRALGEVLPGAAPIEQTGEALWSEWLRRAAESDRVLLRIGVPNRRLGEIVTNDALEDFVADAAAGVVWATCSRPERIAGLQQLARAAEGYAAVLRAPASLRLTDPSGYRPSLGGYMEKLRRRWDPAGILNPDRFALARDQDRPDR